MIKIKSPSSLNFKESKPWSLSTDNVRLIIPIINQDFGSEETNWVGNFSDLIRHRRALKNWDEAKCVDWWRDVECMDSYVRRFSDSLQRFRFELYSSLDCLLYIFIYISLSFIRMKKIVTFLLNVRDRLFTYINHPPVIWKSTLSTTPQEGQHFHRRPNRWWSHYPRLWSKLKAPFDPLCCPNTRISHSEIS